MPTGDVLKVSLFTHSTQRQFINTHYYKLGSVVTSDPFDAAVALSNAWNTAFLGPYRAIMSNETSFGCNKIEEVVGSGLPTFINHYQNLLGTAAGPPLPPNMALIIRRRGTALGKARRSLLFLSGIRVADTDGSFLTAAFSSGDLTTLVNLYNNQLVAISGFDFATFDPVIPHTQRAYGIDLDVTGNLATNELTITAGTAWDSLGFISGGQFAIAAPSANRGTYTATVTPASSTILLSNNQLETAAAERISAQQVIVATDYITLTGAIQQLAIRQLQRRRSSHTGLVA